MITLRPLGGLKALVHDQKELHLEAAGCSVREALLLANIRPELVALVLVNARPVDKAHRLADGDMVQVLTVFGGG